MYRSSRHTSTSSSSWETISEHSEPETAVDPPQSTLPSLTSLYNDFIREQVDQNNNQLSEIALQNLLIDEGYLAAEESSDSESEEPTFCDPEEDEVSSDSNQVPGLEPVGPQNSIQPAPENVQAIRCFDPLRVETELQLPLTEGRINVADVEAEIELARVDFPYYPSLRLHGPEFNSEIYYSSESEEDEEIVLRRLQRSSERQFELIRARNVRLDSQGEIQGQADHSSSEEEIVTTVVDFSEGAVADTPRNRFTRRLLLETVRRQASQYNRGYYSSGLSGLVERGLFTDLTEVFSAWSELVPQISRFRLRTEPSEWIINQIDDLLDV